MNFSVRLFLLLFLTVNSLIATGCETRLNLTMKKDVPPIDRSVVSPKLKEKKFAKIMIIPSPGANRSALEPRIMLIERAFLRLGVTVISPAITGRVVMDSADQLNEKKAEAVRDLSDTERALIMSHATGAEAILQLDDFQWIFPEVKTRYFIGEQKDEGDFREVNYEQWFSWSGQKRHFLSPVLIFVGRVLNVTTGETIASFDISMPANFTLPQDYKARYIYDPIGDRLTKSKLIGEYAFVYHDNSWLQRAMERTDAKVIEYVAETMIAMPPASESPVVSAFKEPVENVPKKNPAPVTKIEMIAPPPGPPGVQKNHAVRIFAAYSGHIASFKHEDNAAGFVSKMKAKGLTAFYREENIPGKGVFYRSYVGGYKTRLLARKALTKLKKDGVIDYFQIRKIAAKDGEIAGKEKKPAQRQRPIAGSQTVVPVASGKPDGEMIRDADEGRLKRQKPEPDLKPEEYFNRGMENFAKEQYEAALDDLNKAIGQDNKFTAAYNKRCFVLYITGDIDSAIKDCTMAISLKADFAEAYYHRGLANQADNQAQSAIADFDRAIAIDSNYEAAYAKRGYVHYLSGRNRLAIDDYTTAVGIKPDDDEAYFNRALAYYDSGNLDKTMADVQKACLLKNEQACRVAEDFSKK